MKKTLVLLTILILAQPILATVRIEEVLYDPINTENGGEAVLLFNKGNETIDISGWVLATKTSSKDTTTPQNTSVSAGGYLLIADFGFSLNKDNSSWPDADFEEAITLQNTNGGVALMNGTNIVDAIGWGDSTNIDVNLYEGIPHQGVNQGQSLRRIKDTDNNSADFIGGTPVFYNISTNQDNNPLEIVIDVEINITNNAPEVLSIEVLTDDNSSREGIQIKPVSGSIKTFEILIEAYDADNSSEIASAKVVIGTKEFSLVKSSSNETNVFFRGNVSMEYYEEARNYTLQTIITSNGQEFSKNSSFEYLALKTISAETSMGLEIAAGNVKTKTVTVRNLGNQDVQLKVKGTNIVNGIASITLNSIEYSTNNFITTKMLTSNYENITTLVRGENLDIVFKVTIDKQQKSGKYNGQIKIMGN